MTDLARQPRNLIPHFILEQMARGQYAGRFAGAGLFVDVAGFSTITDALMQRGQHGAEVLAAVMVDIFTPLIDAVYAQGGFIAGFAGDAFTALFPAGEETPAAIRALGAGWAMQQAMTANARHTTEYGTFLFSIKIGLELGDAVWGVVRSPNGRRAAAYFRGTAVQAAAAAEHCAQSGDLILGPVIHAQVAELVLAEQVVEAATAPHRRVLGVLAPLPEARPIRRPVLDLAQLTPFFPADLLTQSRSGEFRRGYYLFVGVQGDPDPATVDRLLQLVFQLQERYGGLLNRIDFGDKGCNLLLFWGASVSHENDDRRILDFTLALRERAPALLRAGITYRTAHAGFTGSPLREEFTCHGRGVNLAARLMSAAPWGALWVDAPLAQRAEETFSFAYLDTRHFKGFAEPQAVFALEGRRETPLRPAPRHRLVGRRAELNRLADFARPLQQGRFAGAAILRGEPGAGKSRLAHAFAGSDGLPDGTAHFLCQSDEIGRQSLHPFRYWLRTYFRQSRGADETANRQQFDRVYDDLLARTGDERLRAGLERAQSFLAALVDLFQPGSLYDRVEIPLRFENTLDGLKELIRAECHQRPVLLQIEDAHWLDDDSRAFLARLTRNVPQLPLALLVTTREPLAPETWAADAPLLEMELASLPAADVADLAAAILGEPPAANLLDLLAARSDGNPYFVEQMVIYLRDRELLDGGGLTAQLADGDILLPRDTRALLVARLDRLARPVRRLVQTAAIVGREFDRPVLREMVPDPALPAWLRAAEEEGILTPVAGDRYAFHHSLMRDAAYQMQLRAQRQALHGRAAAAYERAYAGDLAPSYGQIAHHYDQAREAEQALGYYRLAADRARDNYQNEASLSYYDRALALAESTGGDDAQRLALLLGRESVLNWVGRREAQAGTLAQMAQMAEMAPPKLQAEIALRHAIYRLGIGEYDPALEAIARSVEKAQSAGDIEAEATARHRWGRILWQQGRVQEARPFLTRALELAASAPALQARCLYDLSVIAYYEADYKAAERTLAESLTHYATTGDRQGTFSCTILQGLIAYQQGAYVDALETFRRALEICREIGWRYGEAGALAQIGNAYFEVGAYEEARQFHQQVLDVCREIGNREDEAVSLDTLGLVAHFQGDKAAAVARFEEALAIHDEIRNVRERAFVLTHLGYARLDQGQMTAATRVLEEALAQRRELGQQQLAQDTLGGLALVAWRQGDTQRAWTMTNQILGEMAEAGIDGIEFPIRLYLICYQIAADARPGQAAEIVRAGTEQLLQRAHRIEDPTLRQSYLQQVPFNRELLAALDNVPNG